MEFRIIAGNTYKAVSRKLYEELKEKTFSLDRKHYVIVPDSASMENQVELMRTVGDKAGFSVEVKTVKGLANLLLTNFDYMARPEGIILLTKIIADLRPSLGCFSRSAEFGGFVGEVYDVIQQLKSCRIPPQSLEKERLPAGLKNKLKDIRLIYEEYERQLGTKVDPSSKLDRLTEKIPESEVVKNSEFYFVDFDAVTPQFEEIVKKLIVSAPKVTLCCVYSPLEQHRYLYPNDLFAGGQRIAEELGISAKTELFRFTENEFSLQAEKYLFSPFPCEKPMECGERLRLYEAEFPAEETDALARYITEEVRKNNARYADFYVVCPNPKRYERVIADSFAEYGIPYFLDQGQLLTQHAFGKFLTASLTAVKNNFRLDDVSEVVKNYFFAESDARVYAFEDFCRRYRMGFSFETFGIGKTDEQFPAAEWVREQFVTAFRAFSGEPKATCEAYLNQVREFCRRCDVEQKLERFQQRQEAEGLTEQARMTEQVFEKFSRVLDEIERLLRGSVITYRSFLEVLLGTLGSVKISTVPQKNDQVMISELAKCKSHRLKRLCVLGASAGDFPVVRGNFRLLNDENLESMKQCGLIVAPRIREENAKEKFNTYQLLCEPTESLYLSYSKADGEGKALQVSSVAEELRLIFFQNGDVPQWNVAGEFRAVTKAQAKKVLLGAVRRWTDHETVDLNDYASLYYATETNPSGYLYREGASQIPCGRNLFFPTNSLSVTRMETFYACPFRHYLQHGLKLRRKEDGLERDETGTLFHRVMELFLKDMDETESDEVSRSRLDKIFAKVLEEDRLQGFFRDGAERAFLFRLKKEANSVCLQLKRHIVRSCYKPYAQEMQFRQSVPFGAETLRLSGKIDRIDTCGKNALLFDYKTGFASFNEQDLYYGKRLQMPTYLAAVEKELGLTVNGFYYVCLKEKYAHKEAASPTVFLGRTVKDVACLNEIDLDFAEGNSWLGIRLTKKGEFYANSKRTLLRDDFQNYAEYALRLMEQGAKDMSSGYMEASPLEGECEYCPYKKTCGFEDLSRRSARGKTAEVSAQTIGDVLYGKKGV